MKQYTLFLCLLLSFILQSGISSGQRIYLSGEDAAHAVPWEFKISAGRNSGRETTIPVPSNWEMHGFGHYTYANDKPDYVTNPEIGYYKLKFNLPAGKGDPMWSPPIIAQKRIRLTFQGSMTDTYVRVNGKSAGEAHRGGFMEFSYEITALVKPGENLLEVDVHKSSLDPNIQQSERVVDFWLFGGIFRPVYLDILPQEIIERVAIDARMDGDFRMNVYLDNIQKADRLVATVFDAGGRPLGVLNPLKVSVADSVLLMKNHFKDIKQWSHETPNLYRVKVELYSGRQLIHTCNQKFGFRTFEVRDHDGFYLNGKRILLKGAALHSFRPETGRALSKEDMEENVRLLKEMNCNTVRPCHYPPDAYFFDLCDSLGLLAMDELTGWHNPLNTANGSRLTKEMIARDVNHPSIILWSNGNHMSHNPEVDNAFFKWDIQQRRPLKNAAQVETWPGNYHPDFDLIDTRYYPDYQLLKERLAGTHIVLPNETLHALYDGSGAAGLYDYWEAFKSSKVGGGLIIWAFFDEGLARTDKNNQIEVMINRAPDGLVGPHGEKEGSFYAAKEIWSPVQISSTKLPHDYNGSIKVKNDFTFLNLSQCQFKWQLINFTSVEEAKAGFRIIAEGIASPGNIPAGSEGNLNIDLPAKWNTYDALRLCVTDNQNNQVLVKTLIIENPESASPHQHIGTSAHHQISTSSHHPIISQDKTDPFLFHVGNKTFKFDEATGVLSKIWVKDRLLPIGNMPYPVAGTLKGPVLFNTEKRTVSLEKQNETYIIEAGGNNDLPHYKWTIFPDGTLELDYNFPLPEGQYYYAGIGMDVQPEKVTGKRWLGNGPYRIWKNRTQGGTLNVWDVEKQVNIPGKKWNYPEFEGFFAPWYWSVIRFEEDQNMVISAPKDSNLALGILKPINGEDPRSAIWHYPATEGIYLFNCISPVGSKWRPAAVFGPASQPTVSGGNITGSIRFSFNGDPTVIDHSIFTKEIE